MGVRSSDSSLLVLPLMLY